MVRRRRGAVQCVLAGASELIKEARVQRIGSSLDLAAVGGLWRRCCFLGAVVTLLDFSRAGLTMELSQTRLAGASSLGAGAVEVKARWRRAVLAIVLSESRIDGEQKEGGGDGVR